MIQQGRLAKWMEPNRLGMLSFVASEAVFFGMLILSYLYYYGLGFYGTDPDQPRPGNTLDPVRTGLFTIFLLASSLTISRAEKSRERRSDRAVSLWLLATIILGAVFLAGQVWEYVHLFERSVTISRNLFGTVFFTLTGFHGLHVFSGLVALAILLRLAALGDLTRPGSVALEAVGLYWHFVDVVWIIIFSVVYLMPLLVGQ